MRKDHDLLALGCILGLFDSIKDFRRNRDDKKIASALAKVKNAKTIREDRVAAIETLKALKDADSAVPALLQRFEYSLEHGINDTREKESCMEGIVAFGPAALPHVREHLMQTTRIAWPIKLLKALGEESEVIAVLKSALDYNDVAFDQAKVDKNYDILCYLRDYQLPGFAKEVAHFLRDPDERVRFAATEVLLEQNDDPAVPSLLEHFIADETPDNIRMRQLTIQAFLSRGWQLEKPERFPEGHIVGPLYVGPDRKLVLRQ